MTLVDDGRIGGGYKYQWYVVLYVLDSIVGKGASSSIYTKRFREMGLDLDNLYIRMEGPPDKFEDFELFNKDRDGSAINRVLFQVKTAQEDHVWGLSNRDFKNVIDSFYKKDQANINAFVFVSNVSFNIQSKLSQAGISPYKYANNKSKRQLSGEYPIDFLDKLHFFNSMLNIHLAHYLKTVSSFKYILLTKSGLSQVIDMSVSFGGTDIQVAEFMEEIDLSSPKAQQSLKTSVNSRFMELYHNDCKLPTTDLNEFLDNYYIKRGCDKDILSHLSIFPYDELIEYLSECINITNKIISKTADSLEHSKIEIKQKYKSTAQADLSIIKNLEKHIRRCKDNFGFLEKLRLAFYEIKTNTEKKLPHSELVTQYEKLKRSLIGGVGQLDQKQLADKLLKTFETACHIIIYFRSVCVLLGPAGMGKTLSVLNQIRHLDCYYAISMGEAVLDYENLMAYCARSIGVGSLAEDFLNHLINLQSYKDMIVIFLDGIDECEGFTPSKFLKLLRSLSIVSTISIRFLITCRSDYIEPLRPGMKFSELQPMFHQTMVRWSKLVIMPRMVEQGVLIWVQKYCDCYGLNGLFSGQAIRFLSYWFTPRVLRHVFASLYRRFKEDNHGIGDAHFRDAIAIHSNYAYIDCNDRRHISRDIPATIDSIALIAEKYLILSIAANHKCDKFELEDSFRDMDDEQDVLDTLIHRCNEIEIEIYEHKLFWRVPQLPVFSLACWLITKYRLAHSYSELGAALELVSKKYGTYACDVAIFLFLELYRLQRLESSEVDKLKWGQMIEAQLNHSFARLSAQIALYQIYGQIISMNKYEDSVFRKISENSVYDFLYAIGDSALKNVEQNMFPSSWCICRLLDVTIQIQRVHVSTDIIILRDICYDFLKLLLDLSKIILDSLNILDYLGTFYYGLSKLSDCILKWAVEKVSELTSIEELDQVLHYLGTLYSNETRYTFAQYIADLVMRKFNHHEIFKWLTSDAMLYECPHYYVRKCVINKFVHIIGNKENGMVDDILPILNSDQKIEKRRNAIFIIQNYYIKDAESRHRSLERIIEDEEDVELISTAVGIIYNDQYSKEPGLRKSANLSINQIIDDYAVKDYSYDIVKSEIENTEDINGFIDKLIKYRGIIEILPPLQNCVEYELSKCKSGDLSNSKRIGLMNLIHEEENMEFVSSICKKILEI